MTVRRSARSFEISIADGVARAEFASLKDWDRAREVEVNVGRLKSLTTAKKSRPPICVYKLRLLEGYGRREIVCRSS